MKNPVHWLTNDPEIARQLRAADDAYDRAKESAARLRLADKMAALRVASDDRAAAYEQIFKTARKHVA